MQVLMLPRYGALGASSRLRLMQYLPWLSAAGFSVDVSSLLDEDYIRAMYKGNVSIPAVARSYVRRLRRLMTARRYNVIWVEKESLPWLPAGLENSLLPRSARLVVDYDDAQFHRYDEHRALIVRTLLGQKIDRVMRRADLVTVGNDYLAAHARAAGAGKVEWIPTVVDLARYPKPQPRQTVGQVIIGWIGSPATAGYLNALTPALEALRKRHEIRCVAIGARPDQVEGTPFEAWEWREQDEVDLLGKIDIGVMPLPDAPWERGKCGYKLIQYMACGLPVVASPVGANRKIVLEGESGFLAEGTDAWVRSITALIIDAPLRGRMGGVGRALVEKTYSLQVQGPRMVELLKELGPDRCVV